MVPQGNRIQSLNLVAGHQVTRNLGEPSEFTMMHLDTYADYLRQLEPRTESRVALEQGNSTSATRSPMHRIK